MSRPKRTPRIPRPVFSGGPMLLKGNRDYVTALRRTCTEALRSGSATLNCEDPDGDDIVTTIVCSRRMGSKIGFRVEAVPDSGD